MAARKSVGKKSSKKSAKKPARKVTAKKKPTNKSARKAPAEKEGVAAADVNLGHVLALRPRVRASFSPEHLRRAKSLLSETRYGSIEEAARAVAEKALETTRDGARKPLGRRRF